MPQPDLMTTDTKEPRTGADLPAAALPSTADVHPATWAARARTVIVNAETTPYDSMADAVLRESISRVLPAIVGNEAEFGGARVPSERARH